MMGESDDDFRMFLTMKTFALRGYLTPIKGYGELLKGYLDARQKLDLPIKIETAMGMDITPELAVQMMAIILKSVHQIYELEEELRNYSSTMSPSDKDQNDA